MQTWEHRQLDVPENELDQVLQSFGQNGWELVSVIDETTDPSRQTDRRMYRLFLNGLRARTWRISLPASRRRSKNGAPRGFHLHPMPAQKRARPFRISPPSEWSPVREPRCR